MGSIGVGIVGAGFVADIHARVYAELAGQDIRLAAVTSRTKAKATRLAERYAIERVADDLEEMLQLPGIDVIDLCVPNQLHSRYGIQAMKAGKHIICEKPLTGYFGAGEEATGATPKGQMLTAALQSANEMVAVSEANHVKLMYAENWLYSPALQKAKRLIKASGGAIFELRGEESHHGSHSTAAKQWRTSGGGSLIRLGSHPIGAILHLKACEGIWRDGKPILPKTVLGDVANLAPLGTRTNDGKSWVVQDWVDVESWSQIIITFDDGSKGTVSANDICLGGLKDTLDIYMSNARLHCNFSRSNTLEAYAPEASVFESEYLVEKTETKAGWSSPSINEDWFLGYHDELRDFIEAIRHDRLPLSDGNLGRSVVQVIYSAYLSAEQRRVVELDEVLESV